MIASTIFSRIKVPTKARTQVARTAIACTPNWPGLPKNSPSAPAGFTALEAKSPVARAPGSTHAVDPDHVKRVVVA
jgi:hypothetical protein